MSFHCKNLQAFILQSQFKELATCTIVVYTHSDQHLIPDPTVCRPCDQVLTIGSGISSRVEVNSRIVSSYNTLFATRIFNTPDPRSIELSIRHISNYFILANRSGISNAPGTSIGSLIGSYPRSTDPRSMLFTTLTCSFLSH